ncbi:hypothetical protein FOCG_05857 [Fusarium oxysporum f. sp. radicis-lycopersici 26381]|uniref:Uncharacterized protein n=1 Tax=Fusarium oxysporum Fo47 TaxID=660027 RepID=W9JUB3_FUSOX|nr:hypothetical protein FOZG_11521 [Fusarium oxysporum Fo47]EWZ96365.1 hypothetical protein FOWG_03764 [Fusarium oxysporum f. sp. lycopersici MN25]EXL55179.1 hypothetical protein FOCG_05857 [Fusarium oxysporum f. sp. radicis-lycopersici 26381]
MSLVHHDVFSYGKSQPHQTMYDASELHDLSGTGTPEIYNNFGNSVHIRVRPQESLEMFPV